MYLSVLSLLSPSHSHSHAHTLSPLSHIHIHMHTHFPCLSPCVRVCKSLKMEGRVFAPTVCAVFTDSALSFICFYFFHGAAPLCSCMYPPPHMTCMYPPPHVHRAAPLCSPFLLSLPLARFFLFSLLRDLGGMWARLWQPVLTCSRTLRVCLCVCVSLSLCVCVSERESVRVCAMTLSSQLLAKRARERVWGGTVCHCTVGHEHPPTHTHTNTHTHTRTLSRTRGG
jgi:hypothetical protein